MEYIIQSWQIYRSSMIWDLMIHTANLGSMFSKSIALLDLVSKWNFFSSFHWLYYLIQFVPLSPVLYKNELMISPMSANQTYWLDYLQLDKIEVINLQSFMALCFWSVRYQMSIVLYYPILKVGYIKIIFFVLESPEWA
jgi:hypothetical protein